MRFKHDSRTGSSLILLVLTVYFYCGTEWLFFATKPSFMDSMSRGDLIAALLVTPLLLLPLAVLGVISLLGLSKLKWIQKIRLNPGLWISTLVLSSAYFLLIDNFLYTVGNSGVVRSNLYTRYLFIPIFLFLLWKTQSFLRNQQSSIRTLHFWIGFVLITASTLTLAFEFLRADLSNADVPVGTAAPGELPDIIFLASDGMEASHLSVYGFQTPTTPFLGRFAAKTLFFENAFSNAGKTTGSVVSMLTGARPETLKVGFPPQILHREDAWKHLPAILRKLGYQGYQRTVRYYVDSADLNLQSSFDTVNDRRPFSPNPGTVGARLLYLFNAEYLFATRSLSRISERLLHIFGIRRIPNHYLLVSKNKGQGWARDQETIQKAKEFIRSQKGPYFMHLHLMGTHCCTFRGVRHWFQDRRLAKTLGVKPGYLNSLRDADANFEDLILWLKKEGRLDRTLIVLQSDHTNEWDSHQRIPLMIYFPGGRHRGRVNRNVELLDVAPTILDYLGLEKPSWMSGESLLARGAHGSARSSKDPIISLSRFEYKQFQMGKKIVSQMQKPGPPLYGVSEIGAVYCHVWKKLNTETGKITRGEVRGHTVPCPEESIPSDSETLRFLREHFSAEGFTL